MTTLNRQALKQLQAFKEQDQNSLPGVVLPRYDPETITASVVHFGPANFAKGHLAVYADQMIAAGHTDCGIVMVSPKLADGFADAAQNRTIVRARDLAAQDNIYPVWVKDAQKDRMQIVASVTDMLVGPNDVQKVIDRMASAATKLVTMTITQNGYYYDPDNGVNMNADDIAHSLKNVDDPRATVAYLVMALEARMNAGLPSFGVMSLDNIEENSARLRRTVLAYAAQKSKILRDWIAHETPFYNTMVDRIVPKPTGDILRDISARIGFEDTQGIATEPYKALVIERSKTGPADMKEPPIPFNEVGALYVDHVAPYELAKLRILNGAHMALGVVGRLCGQTHADDALKDPALKEFVDEFIQQVAGTLQPLEGVDYDQYRQKILERMENPFLHDELARLARNGTEKIASRFISPLRDAYAHDLPRERIVTALAAWVKYVASANDDKTLEIDGENTFFINDEVAYKRQITKVAKSLNGDISPILSIQGLFGGLEDDLRFVKELSDAYKALASGQEQGFALKSGPFTPPEVA